jgi:hypothetical protein
MFILFVYVPKNCRDKVSKSVFIPFKIHSIWDELSNIKNRI